MSKPKLKIKKAIAKRFKVTKTGKLITTHAFGRHLKLKKSKRRLRRLNVPKEVTGKVAIKIKRALGVA